MPEITEALRVISISRMRLAHHFSYVKTPEEVSWATSIPEIKEASLVGFVNTIGMASELKMLAARCYLRSAQ